MPLRRLYDFMTSAVKTLPLSFVMRRLIRNNAKVREGLRHDYKVNTSVGFQESSLRQKCLGLPSHISAKRQCN
jgi:hypothetical protein